MKFKSRKDTVYKLIYGALTILLAILIGESFLVVNFSEDYVFVFDCIMIVIWVFLVWRFFFTTYEVTKTHFIYRSGPLFGKIALKNIKKITVGRTGWSGPKNLALAKSGLVIEKNDGKEIYISPKTNETFVEAIEATEHSILIEEHKHYFVK